MNIEEKSDISTQKEIEILQHKIKVMGKDWVEDRIKAYKSVQEMKKYLNSLSEEEAHKLMVEQVEGRIVLVEEDLRKVRKKRKIKLFWIDIQSSFIFGTQVRKVILLRFRLQNGRRPISNTLKIGRIIFSV